MFDPSSWNLYTYARNNPLSYIDPSGEVIELIGTEDERNRAFEIIKNSVGSKAASMLRIRTEGTGNSTRYFVDVLEGLAISSLANVSREAAQLADLIRAKPIVEFGVVDRDLPGDGAREAAYTYAPGEIGNANVRVLLNPAKVAALNPTGLLRLKWDTNALLRRMTPSIAAWHEFGHAWAMWVDMNARTSPLGGIFTDPSRGLGKGEAVKRAVEWENRMRESLYGPLGPQNARRIFH